MIYRFTYNYKKYKLYCIIKDFKIFNNNHGFTYKEIINRCKAYLKDKKITNNVICNYSLITGGRAIQYKLMHDSGSNIFVFTEED